MNKKLMNLSVRTGAVQNKNLGYILAADPDKDEEEVLHTHLFECQSGNFKPIEFDFSAHTCCVISSPGAGLVIVAGFGEYGVLIDDDIFEGSIFYEQPSEFIRGAFREVTTIEGKAYAAGLRGIVFRLDNFTQWTPMHKALPPSVNIESIDGFNSHDIYVAGDKGEVWHYDGNSWRGCDIPTNANLNAIKCAGDGYVYIAGNNGALVRGRNDLWETIALDKTIETIWDLEWFKGKLYCSTISFVYRLEDDSLNLVDFGDDDEPDTFYQLSVADGVMWSIGSEDIFSFDGIKWARIL